MTKKRLVLFAIVPLIIAVILGVLAMLPPRPGVTKANFDHIQEGMTEAEVEGILGRGELSRGEVWWYFENDGSVATIWFRDACVLDKAWTESTETILDKIRRWLHLR